MASGSAPAVLHLVLGEDEFLTERATTGVVSAVRAATPAGQDPPVVSRLGGPEVTAPQLFELLSPSLFGEARIVVVTGNVHAMRLRPGDAPEGFPAQPMTALLQDLKPYSVNVTAARGAYWACGETCGIVEVAPSRGGGREGAGSPFDYRLVLPVFTPIRQVDQIDPAP